VAIEQSGCFSRFWVAKAAIESGRRWPRAEKMPQVKIAAVASLKEIEAETKK
jgi:predicted NAD-dependent protein-ADP-ribosyltransferase YbiA (DUF1768 family)